MALVHTALAAFLWAAAPARSWNGIGIKGGVDCTCCGLVFPKGFGKAEGELALLREIAEGKGRAAGLGCNFAYKLEVFEHLIRLAIDEKVDAAAMMVLQADADGGIPLGGGELSETVGSRFMFPVLRGRPDLGDRLAPALQQHVATKICVGSLFSPSQPPLEVEGVIGELRRVGMEKLAARVREVCARMTEELKR
jgi:hypothetical protein